MVYSLFWLYANPVTVELLYIKRKLKIEFNKKKLSFVQPSVMIFFFLSFFLLGMILGESEILSLQHGVCVWLFVLFCSLMQEVYKGLSLGKVTQNVV